MKEKILQALTTFKGYLFSSDKLLHLAAGFYYRLLRGAFRASLWVLRRYHSGGRQGTLRQNQQEGNPGIMGFYFHGSRRFGRAS